MKTLLTSLLLALLVVPALITAQEPAPAEPFDPSELTNPLASIPMEPAPAAVPTPAAPAAPTDPDLPQPFDPAALAAVVQTSPFNRAVNMSDSLVLTGLAYVEKKPLATLMDKETKKTYVVSETPNPQGWTLVEATPTTDLKRTQIKVKVAGEVVTIRHDNQLQMDMRKHKTAPGGTSSGGDRDRGGDGGFRGERRGPPPEAVERYNKLSDGAKEKLRSHFTENRERIMNMNPEERRAYMETSFKRIADEDEKGRR